MSKGVKKLMKELKEFNTNLNYESQCSFQWPTDDLYVLDLVIEPLSGIHSGARYVCRVTIPPSYPSGSPSFQFETPVLHPNISSTGTICFNLLKERNVSIDGIANGMLWLLEHPNFESPLNSAVDRHNYRANVQLAIAGKPVTGIVTGYSCLSPTYEERKKKKKKDTLAKDNADNSPANGARSGTPLNCFSSAFGPSCVIL